MRSGRLLFALVALLIIPASASAQNIMCDPAYQKCRVPLIALMDQEMVGIDMLSWFSEDYRYIAALDRAKRRGVRVRFIGNDRWDGARKTFMLGLKQYNIPARLSLPTISHIKAVVFAGQMKLYFTGSNFTPFGLNPVEPYVNYTDETVIITPDVALVRTFQRVFEDLWCDSTKTVNYSGVTDRIRRYPLHPVDTARVEIGFGSSQPQNKRAALAIDKENVGIDVIMYRMNDVDTRDALVRALKRGVPVRILTDPISSSTYSGQSSYEKTLLALGAKIRRRVHQGLTHEKLAILHGQSVTVIPTNNWDVWPARSATLYLTDEDVYQWATDHFNRKWQSRTEFK